MVTTPKEEIIMVRTIVEYIDVEYFSDFTKILYFLKAN